MPGFVQPNSISSSVRPEGSSGEGKAVQFDWKAPYPETPQLVEEIFDAARRLRATDIHLQPDEAGWDLRFRIDSVLQMISRFPPEIGKRITQRLKVLAELLTYRHDVPQEGRIVSALGANETRLSTFPTLFGEKSVVRLSVGSAQYCRLDDLGLHEELLESLRDALGTTGGVILLTGPAGSGKTTTAYACLREIVERTGGTRNVVSLEDPVEVVLQGVAQSQVRPEQGFDLATGLRSLLRQDPEVIFVGEIRDRSVAEVVFQASLSGHLVITTFHAGSAVEAVCRLSDLGIEPFVLRSSLRLVVGQRLFRKLCECSQERESGIQGCAKCAGTGFLGRFVLAEMLAPGESHLARKILDRIDAPELEQVAREAGFISLEEWAKQAVEQKRTTSEEVFRVLGRKTQTGY